MAISLPTRGQRDWDDELNNALNQMDASAEDAKSKASSAVSTANNALNVAQAVQGAVIGTANEATASFVTDEGPTKDALSATYARQDRGPANVRDFGAKGDGTTNDTAAIQAAINTGRPVYFPEGVYSVGALTKTSGVDLTGDGMNASILRARPGTGTLLTNQQVAGARIEGLWFDGNGQATTCLDTTWTDTGAPSQGNVYRDLRVSGYTGVGWLAGRNNDSPFDNVLIEASGTNVGLRINAIGGQIMLKNSRFFAPTEIGCQSAEFTDCVMFGVRIIGADWNVLQVTGGYWYADPVNHCNVYIGAGLSAYPAGLHAAHIENGFADGAVFGGPGAFHGASLVGCHVFGMDAGVGAARIVSTALTAGGPRARIAFQGGMIEGLVRTSTTAQLVTLHNTSVSGAYTDSAVEVASSDGGSRTFVTHGAIKHDEGAGEHAALTHRVGVLNQNTDGAITGLPRSGILSLRTDNASGPSIVVAYGRVAALTGTVTTIQTISGSSGQAWTVTVPSSAAESGLTTSVVIRHNSSAPVLWFATVIGF